MEEDVTAVCECCSCHVYLSRNNVCPAICTVYFMTVVHTVDIDYTKSVVDNMELITSYVWSVVDTVNSDHTLSVVDTVNSDHTLSVADTVNSDHTLSVADTVDIDYIASVDGMADIDYIRTGRCQCHALQGL